MTSSQIEVVLVGVVGVESMGHVCSTAKQGSGKAKSFPSKLGCACQHNWSAPHASVGTEAHEHCISCVRALYRMYTSLHHPTCRDEEGVAHGALHRPLGAARQQLRDARDAVAHDRRTRALHRMSDGDNLGTSTQLCDAVAHDRRVRALHGMSNGGSG